MAQANIEIRLSNGKQAGQTINELRQQSNRLNKEINNLKPGSDEFIKKTADFKKVTGRLKDVRGEVKGTQKAAQGMTDSFAQFIPFGGQLQNMARGARSGVMAFKSLKVAIAATGVGLLVLAIGSLVAWFQRTEEGAQKLRVIMAAVGQVFASLMDVAVNLGKSLFETFSNPKQAVTDLWEFIKTNLLNRLIGIIDTFKFVGKTIQSALELDWDGVKDNAAKAGESILQSMTGVDDLPNKMVEGFKSGANAAKSLFAEVKKDTEGAIALQERENALKVRKREFLIEEAKLNVDIAEARRLGNDQTLSDEVRQKALADAMELVRKKAAANIKIKEEELAIQRERNDLSESSEDDLEKAAQLEAELINIRKQAADEQRTIMSRESGMRKRQLAEIEKELAEREKMEAEARRNIEDLAIEIMDEGLEKELAQMQLETERKIEALTGSEQQIAEQKRILLTQSLREQQNIRDEFAQEEANKDIQNKEEAKERNEELQAAIVANLNQGVAALTSSIDARIAQLSRDEESTRRNAERIKSLEKSRVNLSYFNEIAGIWSNANQNPMNKFIPGFGAILAAGLTIAATQRRNQAIRGIENQEFEQGGFVNGPRHSQGGVPALVGGMMPIEMEGGEFIFSRRAVAGIGVNNLAQMNAQFQNGGPVDPFNNLPAQMSGATGGSTPQKANQQAQSQRELIMAFQQYAEKVDNWAKNLKVNANLQEVNEGINTLNKLQDSADV